MKKGNPKSTKKIPTKETPTKLDLSFDEAVQRALNTPVKKLSKQKPK